jgi:hypothetical protein
MRVELLGLIAHWKKDTWHCSHHATDHFAFRQIVKRGMAIVPHIIDELRQRPGWVVLALAEITGQNPVPESDRGNLNKMVVHWIRWWEEQRND